jgi:hypothetical protein
MSKYEEEFRRLLPEARALREVEPRLRPQEVCHRLALIGFGHRSVLARISCPPQNRIKFDTFAQGSPVQYSEELV